MIKNRETVVYGTINEYNSIVVLFKAPEYGAPLAQKNGKKKKTKRKFQYDNLPPFTHKTSHLLISTALSKFQTHSLQSLYKIS